MFALGSSLRQARVRRGVELSQVAAETQGELELLRQRTPSRRPRPPLVATF